MAVNSMEQILGYVSDGKLRKLIEEYEEKHQKLEYESFRKLTELNEAGKEPEKMASAFSWLSTEMKMMMKGDDRQAAKITCILIVNNETAAMYPFPRFARRFLSQYVQETKNYVCVSSFIAASKALSYIFPHYFRGHTGLSVRGVFLP